MGGELDWEQVWAVGPTGGWAEDAWLRLLVLTLPSPHPPNSSPPTCTHIPSPRVLGSPSLLAHTRPRSQLATLGPDAHCRGQPVPWEWVGEAGGKGKGELGRRAGGGGGEEAGPGPRDQLGNEPGKQPGG